MKWTQYLTCFATGAAILVLELAAFRLLAPHFGTSSHVTGIIINGILLALAAGYLLGGAAADRRRSAAFPFLVILGSAVYLGAMYAAYPAVLGTLGRLPVIAGASISVGVLFFVPMALLAFVPPYFIRALSRESEVGATAGRIYALSTLGSICGGLGTTFWLLPELGTRVTFLSAIGALLSVSVLGLARFHRSSPLLLGLFPPLLLAPGAGSPGAVYTAESSYNVISVTEEGGRSYLKLNEDLGYHSVTPDGRTRLTGDYYDLFLFAHLLVDARETLVLGNGAGTTMTQIHGFFETRVDGVELDPALTEVGRAFFDLPVDDRIELHVGDARVYLAHTEKRYDVVHVDIYSGSPYVPFHTATVEFFRLIHDALDEDGIVAVNIPPYSLGTELAGCFENTIARVFPDVFFARRLVFGFKRATSLDAMRRRVESRVLSPSLRAVSDSVLAGLRRVGSSGDGCCFTDDHAPVESMAFGLIEQLRDARRSRGTIMGAARGSPVVHSETRLPAAISTTPPASPRRRRAPARTAR